LASDSGKKRRSTREVLAPSQNMKLRRLRFVASSRECPLFFADRRDCPGSGILAWNLKHLVAPPAPLLKLSPGDGLGELRRPQIDGLRSSMAAVRYRIGLCKRQRRENPGRPRGAVVYISVNRCIKKYRLKNRFSRRFSNGEILQNIEKTGAPGEIRTPDPQIRSLVLYPAELRARMAHAAGFWAWAPRQLSDFSRKRGAA
jgi:hypothetical protein